MLRMGNRSIERLRWRCRWVRPLALGTLQTLADRQGTVVDPMSEEEPGKILHEVRLDVSGGLSLGGKSVYYSSVNATPLFLMVLESVSHWDLHPGDRFHIDYSCGRRRVAYVPVGPRSQVIACFADSNIRAGQAGGFRPR